MGVLLTNDNELKTVADAIRAKTGSSSALGYPDGMATAIAGIGSDCNAGAGDILSPKTAYVGSAKVTGTIPSKAAATYNTSASDQTISAGQYLSGAQTIKGVTTTNLSAANIKYGVTAQVGDSGDSDRVASVTGTFTEDGNIAAGDVLSGKIGYSKGNKITGSIASKAAATYNTSSSDQSISSGQYLSGAQTIKAVTTSNLSAANIKNGVNVKVGDANNAGRIVNITGTFASDATIAAGDVLSGKVGYNGANKITGTIPSKAAATYNTSSSDQTISTGQYISGTQTIKAVTTSNISAGNIKYNVVAKVGDANNAGRIANVTGTFTSDGDISAGDVLSGKKGYAKGSLITGTISSKAAATYNTSSSDQSISAGQYLSGAQTIKAVTTSNISAANIKSGVNIKVGDANSSGRIANVTGTYTSDGTITAAEMPRGKIAYSQGNRLEGTAGILAAATYNVSTSGFVIAAGQYLSGAQNVRGVTTLNIAAPYIRKGVTVKVGDSADAGRIANVSGTLIPGYQYDYFMPFIYGYDKTGVLWRYGAESSGTTAQKANGYTAVNNYYTSDKVAFAVCTKVILTGYTTYNASSTSTITLNVNTSYYFCGSSSTGSQYLQIRLWDGGSLVSDLYKITAWRAD